MSADDLMIVTKRQFAGGVLCEARDALLNDGHGRWNGLPDKLVKAITEPLMICDAHMLMQYPALQGRVTGSDLSFMEDAYRLVRDRALCSTSVKRPCWLDIYISDLIAKARVIAAALMPLVPQEHIQP